MGKRARKRTGHSNKRFRENLDSQVLAAEVPALETLHDIPTFDDFAIDAAQQAAFEAFCTTAEAPDQMRLGVVIRLDRGFPLVTTVNETFRAEHAVAFAKQDIDKQEVPIYPAVGDRVAVRCAPDHDMGVIEQVLPRHNAFERWRGRARGERQVLCANVDTILVVQALGAGEVLLDRIARSLVLTYDCGAQPAVVLTKADRLDDDGVAHEVAQVKELIGPSVPMIVTSSVNGTGIDEVRALVPKGTCAMILGESGAGKSTLLNTLLGHKTLATGEVRERDDQGRHTTVARVMVVLPQAGVIADAPGLRSLPLVGHERGLARTFPEIIEAARSCRFNDCTHTHEPGCAVRALEATGNISSVRLEAFLALASTMRVSAQSLDPDIHV